MPTNTTPTYLFASPDPALLRILEPVLRSMGAQVEITLSAEAAMTAMTAPNPPALAVLDANLCEVAAEMDIVELLATVRAESSKRLPIVVIADTNTHDGMERVGVDLVDDLVPRTADASYWRCRLTLALHMQRMTLELEALLDATARNAQLDRLTGVYNREAMLSRLFRETDRVQRMGSSLSLILYDVDDFGHWTGRLGADACDDLLGQISVRTTRLMRSYDLLGRVGKDEFLLGLPGCSTESAAMLAERLRTEVFCSPFHVAGESIRLSACFGIASSYGRSPVVVLREAEQALQYAKAAGPEAIQSFGDFAPPDAAPVTFHSESSGDELLAW